MISYPKNQAYLIIPSVLGQTRFPEYFAVARKRLDGHQWIWNWDRKNSILKEFAENPDCEILNHEEALEKMQHNLWKLEEEEF